MHNVVRDEQGAIYHCATRRLLKTLATDQRHVVIAGDVVWFRPEGQDEGMIERVEPRHGVLSRTSRGRQHVLVANVDQMLIVTSAAEPRLKPNLIDRFLVSAEKAAIRPVICINKIDLLDSGRSDAAGGRLRPARLRGAVDVRRDGRRPGPAARASRRRGKRRRRAERGRQIVVAQCNRAGARAAGASGERRVAKRPAYHDRPPSCYRCRSAVLWSTRRASGNFSSGT